MMRFVRLSTPDGGWIPVNPHAVQYLRQVKGQTLLVFGAMTGGLHEVAVEGPIELVLETLMGPPAAGATAPKPRRSS